MEESNQMNLIWLVQLYFWHSDNNPETTLRHL